MDISMGYDGWVLAYAPVLVGLSLSPSHECLRTAGQRGMIRTSGMFFNVNNGSSCALALRALVRSARRPVGHRVT